MTCPVCGSPELELIRRSVADPKLTWHAAECRGPVTHRRGWLTNRAGDVVVLPRTPTVPPVSPVPPVPPDRGEGTR